MRKSSTDRNILFGIFAFQNGFITRQALVLAMKTWVLNKQKPLSQVLREQDAVDPDSFALLEALVLKYLAMHGNDAGKSLAAANSLAEEVLEELARISDSEVRASASQAGADATIDLVPETTVAVGASSSKGLRFRILRPHAKGGLGLVYVAHDEELNRDVALKEIQDRHADHPESRTRFMLEAEITGGLEHPGIVPVYGLGQYADGRPFYAMRFIRGDSLKDAIAKFHGDARPLREKSLHLRELLERLIDVCNAMQYAHDRGVLHRDLKPGNIMLGKYGETLIVDWGLAKTLSATGHESPTMSEEPMLRPASGSGSAATLQGSAVGTPQFMSPEQAAGRLDQLGPASDIYSLGATLYSLLTGRAPFEANKTEARIDMTDLLRRVQTGDFPAPRQVNPEISPPLEAICLKSMARNPADRYVNPRALIDDIKHWLADEPVSAWPEPWTVRTRRWMARHRTLVTGVAAALVVGIATLSVATALLAQANDVIRKNNQDLTDANIVIKQESAEKEKQRKLAESRLRQSLDAVGLFANDARNYCDDALVPGESRRRLYEVLTTQLERQVDEEQGEASIDSLRNKLWMYQTLCSVNVDFGEYGKSKIWFDKGIKTADQWEKLRPGAPLALSFRAALLHLRGVSLERQQKLIEAKRHAAEALAIRRKLMGNPEVDSATMGNSIALVADSLDSLEQFAESLKLREQVARLYEKDKDASFPYREAWCWTLQKAALDAKDYSQRKALLTQADQMSAELMRERKTNRKILQRWATIAKAFGELEYNFGKIAAKDGKAAQATKHFADAKIHYEKLNDISRKLATSAELIDGVRDYSRSYYTLGLVEDLHRRPEKARAYYEMSREIRALALRDYNASPAAANLQIDLLFSQVALRQLRDSIELADNLVWPFKAEPDAEYRLACIYALAINAIADARKPNPLTAADQRLQNRYRNDAIRCLQIAHDGGFSDFFHTTIDADLEALRDDPRMKEFEATHAYQLGNLAKKRGEPEKARGHFEKSQQLANEWLKALPNDGRHIQVQINSLCARVQLGQLAEAIAICETLQEKIDKQDGAARFRLARVYALASAAVTDAKLREDYRTKSFSALQQAGDAVTEQRLIEEVDLESIRADSRFKAILEQAKKKQ